MAGVAIGRGATVGAATGGAISVGVATTGAAAGGVLIARAATGGAPAVRAATVGCFSNRSLTCRSFSSSSDIITRAINRSDNNRAERIGNDVAGDAAGIAAAGTTATDVTAAGTTAAGTAAAGVTAAGDSAADAVTEAVAAGAACGVAVFSGTVPVTMGADLPACSTVVSGVGLGIFVSGWGSQASGWLNFCSKTARAAAWAGLSAARAEMPPATRTRHRPREILFFMKLSTFISFCEHPRGQFNRLLAGNVKRFLPLRKPRRDLCCPGTGEFSDSRESPPREPQSGECPNNVHRKKHPPEVLDFALVMATLVRAGVGL